MSIEATEPSIDHGRRPVASRVAREPIRDFGYSRVPWPAAAQAAQSGGSPRATTEALFRLARTCSSSGRISPVKHHCAISPAGFSCGSRYTPDEPYHFGKHFFAYSTARKPRSLNDSEYPP